MAFLAPLKVPRKHVLKPIPQLSQTLAHVPEYCEDERLCGGVQLSCVGVGLTPNEWDAQGAHTAPLTLETSAFTTDWVRSI